MTNKDVGYQIANIFFKNLDGFDKIWNIANAEIKDDIINEISSTLNEDMEKISFLMIHAKMTLTEIRSLNSDTRDYLINYMMKRSNGELDSLK